MKAAQIKDGVVVNVVVVNSLQDLPDLVDAHGANIGDLWDGEAFTPPPPPVKSAEEIQAEIVAATQARLDAFARTRNYDGILSACTYATSSVPKFKAEGQYCVDARDGTWAPLYTIMSEVEAGTRQMPTGFADVEPSLPQLTWPL
jgi:hypothetical protein